MVQPHKQINKNLKKKNFRFFYGPRKYAFRFIALHIKKKYRNYFFTLTDMHGNVILSLSASKICRSRKKRVTPQTAEAMTRRLIPSINAHRVTTLIVHIKMRKRILMWTILKVLKTAGINIEFLTFHPPHPHNGCRKKRKKRL